MKVTDDKILAIFRLQLSSKEACITRVIDTDVYEQYYARLAQAYDVMMKMIGDLK